MQDADHIYFAAELRPATASAPWDWAIYSYDKHARTFAQLTDGLDEQPRNLFVADGHIYFAEFAHVPANAPYQTDRVFTMAVTSSAPTLLSDGLGYIEDLAADGAYVYVADIGRYDVNAVGIAPPHRMLTLAHTGEPYDTAAPPPFALLAEGDWLYYATQGEPQGAIRRVPRPPAHATQADVSPTDELVASGMIEASSMAVKDGTLYWTEYFDGLQRGPLDGGTPQETLVTFHQQGNHQMVIVGDWVYFHARHTDNTGDVIAQYHITP